MLQLQSSKMHEGREINIEFSIEKTVRADVKNNASSNFEKLPPKDCRQLTTED